MTRMELALLPSQRENDHCERVGEDEFHDW
jgi:hypothetical protein